MAGKRSVDVCGSKTHACFSLLSATTLAARIRFRTPLAAIIYRFYILQAGIIPALLRTTSKQFVSKCWKCQG